MERLRFVTASAPAMMDNVPSLQMRVVAFGIIGRLPDGRVFLEGILVYAGQTVARRQDHGVCHS